MSLISFDIEKLKEIRAIPTLDTMKEFDQVIKVYVYDKRLIVLCLDRVHKKNPSLSKPLGYINLNGAYASCLAKALIEGVKVITGLISDEGVLALGV